MQNQNGEAVALTGKKEKIIKAYIKVKDALNDTIAKQIDPSATEQDLAESRQALNKAYDVFVKRYGYLNNAATAKNFVDDPSAGMVQALEKFKLEGTGRTQKLFDVKKAAIFTERTMEVQQEITHADSPSDALLASLANTGGVDLDYMAKLLNAQPEKVTTALKGKIFKNPQTENYETREEYLSGNVREKLAQAIEAARTDKDYQLNVDELKKIQPQDLVSSEIYAAMGAPWIPASDINDFLKETRAKSGGFGSVEAVFTPGLAKWTVNGRAILSKYAADGIGFSDLLNNILNNKAIEIYDGSGKDKTLNQEKTDAANAVADRIRDDFSAWLWSDKAREKRLVDYYNANYNNTVLREYDGSHLDFHAHGMNVKINLRPHQKNVVWRMLQKANTLIAHCVGAGKTFEMQAAGMEMRRLGIAKKPLYCLPNNVVEQFAREFRQLYPNAKLLVLQSNDLPSVIKKVKTADGREKLDKSALEKMDDKAKARYYEKRTARNRMLARIQTEDWDGIILSHSLFERLPLTPETTAGFINEQIKDMEETLYLAKGDRGVDSRALSGLESRIKTMKERVNKILNTSLEEIGIPFEKLGIDQIFVDEADLFKNLGFSTSLDRISGLTNSDANRSNDMFVKTQWLTRQNGGRGVVFATGTPISNTMAEMFTMLRYLNLNELKTKGLSLFDNWIRTFGEIGTGIERKPDGNGFRKVNKVKRFINMPELIKMFRSVADVKTQDDLNLDIPKLKDGKPTIVTLRPDPVVDKYIKETVPKRIAQMKGGMQQKGADNMLSLTNDLRKLSLTDGKINACAERIANKFEETADTKGAQLVFCDLGIPKAEKDTAKAEGGDQLEKDADDMEVENVKVYQKLKDRLIAMGIPKKQIAFVQDAKTKAKLDELFRKVDAGEIRILIGSTQKMGAGTNCQHHLVALHDIDAPWRPRDLEQRHGRILRQGNPNKEVEIFNYVVQDSFDANMWEKLKNKAAIISQAMSGNTQLRAVEDADPVTLTYAEAEGAATGNPLIKKQLDLQGEVTKLANAVTAFKRQQRAAEEKLSTLPKTIAADKAIAEKIQTDIEERTDTAADSFKMTVGKETYTDRQNAEAALKKILDVFSKETSTEIGGIGGMKLNALKTKDHGLLLQLINNRAYNVETNTVRGIESALRSKPEAMLRQKQEEISVNETSLTAAQNTLKQENPYEEKLNAAKTELDKINKQIESELVDSSGKNASYSLTQGNQSKQRAIKDLLREIVSALPKAKDVQYNTRTEQATFVMPNGAKVEINLHDEIAIDNENAARKAHGIQDGVKITVNGKERTISTKAIIDLAKNGREGTIHHEVFHAVWDMCLTDKEKAALSKAYSQEAKATKRDLEEVCADKYRDWWLAKSQGKWTNYGKIWQKIKDMVDRIRRVIAKTAEVHEIFKQIEGGDIWQRNIDNLSVGSGYISMKLFTKYLGNGKMKMIHDDVNKVVEQMDLSSIVDEISCDDAREALPYIKRLVTQYNQLTSLKREDYKNFFAVKLEYARRCFNYAERIRERLAEQVERNNEPERIYKAEQEDFSPENAIRNRNDGRRAERLANRVTNERSNARKRFEKLCEDEISRSNRDGFSSGHYSVSLVEERHAPEHQFLNLCAKALGKKLGLKSDKIIVEEEKNEKGITFLDWALKSPSRIAEKVAAFRAYYRMADNATKAITKNRTWFDNHLAKAYAKCQTKEDKDDLFKILLDGDSEQKEWTRDELIADGVKAGVADAYIAIRRLMNKAYGMVNEARRRPKFHTINGISDRKLKELKDNKFIEIMQTRELADGSKAVTYKEYANHEAEYKNIDADTLDQYRNSNAMQILLERQNADGTYNVKVREGIADLNKLTGYIPHFFHQYMIRVTDKQGKVIATIGSGRTENEAVARADEWLKDNELGADNTIRIAPKAFDFTQLGMDETKSGAVMGDKDFYSVMESLAKNNGMTLDEAREMLKSSVKLKNRHRFFGNALHRKGVAGYEKDLNYVLNHYFHSAVRYHALETMFKPQAINRYERQFGDFNKVPPSITADYIRDYINDINGNPTVIEKLLNDTLNRSKWYRRYVTANFGERSALRATSTLTNATSYLCLGYLNTSSALLNLTQVMNAAAYIGDVNALAKCIAKGMHRQYKMSDLKILVETGVLDDVGLDSGAGYDINRMSAKDLLGKLNRGGMVLFKATEGAVRRGTVLAAYEAGRKRGMTHKQAIDFAVDVNRKSNFDYSVADAPNIFRRGSVISQIALQFKKYGIKELEVMADMFPTNSKTNFKQKAIFWACFFLTAGLM